MNTLYKILSVICFVVIAVPHTAAQSVGDMGGTFNVSESGAATYTIPFDLPDGLDGVRPDLGLVYNSQSGNGVAGMGVSIYGLSSITRSMRDISRDGRTKGILYTDADVYSIDGTRIIQLNENDYRPENQPTMYIQKFGSGTSQTFRASLPNGCIAYYEYKATANVPYAWYLSKMEYANGNVIYYNYTTDNGCVYLSKVTYGANLGASSGLENVVNFEYESRDDASPYIVNAVKCSMKKRLKTVRIKTNNNTYRIYTLEYINEDAFSRLKSVTESNGSSNLPAVTFSWNTLSGTSMIAKTVNKQGYDFGNQVFSCGDVTGDGKTNVIALVNEQNGKTVRVYEVQGNTIAHKYDVSGYPKDISIANFAGSTAMGGVINFFGNGCHDLVLHDFTFYPDQRIYSMNMYIQTDSNYVYLKSTDNTHNWWNISSKKVPLMTYADFYNAGTTCIVQLGDEKYPDGKYAIIVFYHDISKNQPAWITFSFTLPSDPENMFAADYNGDGLQDLLVVYKNGYTIYWNNGAKIGSEFFSENNKKVVSNSSGLKGAHLLQPGDFNGDGLVDFISNATDDATWYLYINNGDGTFEQNTAITNGVYDIGETDKDNDKFSCQVTDFNNDGKQDVIIVKANYTKKSNMLGQKWYEFNHTSTQWYRSTGTSLELVKNIVSNREDDAVVSNFLIGDFNGDGYEELMNYGHDCWNGYSINNNVAWRMYNHFLLNVNSNKVTSINVEKTGIYTSINYSTLCDGAVYTSDKKNKFPLVDLSVPLNVVKTVQQTLAGNYYTTNYTYKNLVAHVQGRGMLGFGTVSSENTTTGQVTTTTVNARHSKFCEPTSITSYVTMGGKTSRTETAMDVKIDYGNVHFTYPKTIKETDIYNNTTTTTNTYNLTHYYPTKQYVSYGGSSMYKQVEYSDYIKVGRAWQPQTIKQTQKHKSDDTPFSSTTSITYNATTGKKTKVIENVGTVPVTHDYTYDTFGNVLTDRMSADGVPTETITYTYDATHRYPTSVKSSATSVYKTYTYNVLGYRTSESEGVSGNMLKTTYTNDGFGNPTKISHPDGTSTTITRDWSNMSNKCYFVKTQTSGQPAVTTYYDNINREVETTTTGEKGVAVSKTTSYNVYGEVASETSTTGNLSLTDSYTYNSLGQLTVASYSSGKTITYTHGNRQVSYSDGSTINAQSYDAWGNILSSHENNCTGVLYTYSSNGQPLSVRYTDMQNKEYAYTFEYDAIGRQTSLTDPDAGVATYEYDALGRTIRQTDARGNVTTNTYNAAGLLTKTVCGDITTTYTYDSRNRLTKESTGNQSVSYTYDDFDRLTKKTYSIDGTNFAYTYTYNTNGQLSSKSFPDGVTENYTYGYGKLQKIEVNSQRVWERGLYTGTVRQASLGPQPLNLTRKYTDKGILAQQEMVRQAGSLHKMTYNFDAATGNLKSRTGMFSTAETFAYDNFDRLTRASDIRIGYDLNGNITSKTGIGGYTYDNDDKPHAVKQVQNTDNLIDNNNQSITYTAFNKVASITQGGDILNITYNPSRQRCKTVLISGGTTTTTFYADNYEQRTSGGSTTTYHYVDSPDGIAAVFVKKGSGNATPYYIETDHLGSIINIYDYFGDNYFSASYDAWGVQTITKNVLGITRGYCGHEHWSQFGLIDMNGRFYDPLLGRFLSPDPYVQAPENPQNFNRYSYCLNNPLKYTDPTGKFVWWPMIVSTYMSALIGGGFSEHNGDGFWKGFWKGAINGVASAGVGYGMDVLTKGFTAVGLVPGAFSRGIIDGFSGGIAGGLSNMLTGGNFGHGFIEGSASGFVTGAIKGGSKGYKYAKQLIGEGWEGSAFTGKIVSCKNTISLNYKDIGVLQRDKSKHCYAYVLEYADFGFGNKKADFFIAQANHADGYDAITIANKEKSGMAGNYFFSNDAQFLEQSLQANNNSTYLAVTSTSETYHWVVVEKATFANKVKIFGGNTKRILLSADI